MPAELAPGTKAPRFTAALAEGGQVSLSNFAGQKLVLYFFPKSDTPGCTREAQDFSRLAAAFAKAGTAILGISADPMKKQQTFRTKHGLSVPLGSDETGTMLRAYGVWVEKSMYGRKFMGIARTTVLIGRDGRTARIWPKVTVEGHAEEVLAAAKAL